MGWAALEGILLHSVIPGPRLPLSWDADRSSVASRVTVTEWERDGMWSTSVTQDAIKGHACSWLCITSASLLWEEPNHVAQPIVRESGKVRGVCALIGEYHCLCYTCANDKEFTYLGKCKTEYRDLESRQAWRQNQVTLLTRCMNSSLNFSEPQLPHL